MTAVVHTIRSHGTRARYVHDGCRCGPCREANAAYQRARRRPSTSKGGAEAMPWADRAACRFYPQSVFFPEAGGYHAYAEAKAVCATCPVQAECAAYALRTGQPAGCWGGLTPEERGA